jgi:polysaccharide deacetylase family protein (PEP-CTERM system associated)
MPPPLRFGPPVITVDVEDWPQSTWDHELPITDRVVVNTRRMLDVLGEANVKATLFVLGKVARTFPGLVKEIRAGGHEIASHGSAHVEIFRQSREAFATDIRESKDLLEQILGEAVRGYRAPDFSIVRETLWAFEVLAETGFEYDSSIFPVRRPRYGIPDWPTSPVNVVVGGREVLELPLATFRGLGRNWPIGGGGYHRLLPGPVSRYLAGRMMQSCPFVFYCHPYELDAAEFRELPLRIPWRVRLHQGLGRRPFAARVRAFLRRFGGRPLIDLVRANGWPRVALHPSGGATIVTRL